VPHLWVPKPLADSSVSIGRTRKPHHLLEQDISASVENIPSNSQMLQPMLGIFSPFLQGIFWTPTFINFFQLLNWFSFDVVDSSVGDLAVFRRRCVPFAKRETPVSSICCEAISILTLWSPTRSRYLVERHQSQLGCSS
jgi:hypothetical protein